MITLGFGGYDIVIHVSLLRQVIREREEHQAIKRKEIQICSSEVCYYHCP